jgi:1,4-dihydroxy-2-naphthoate octaprenyltransferase
MQSGTLADTNVWLAALASGLVVDTLLVVNNYRDREADRISGKRTLVVRFGERFGSGLYLGLGVVASLLFAWVIYNPADVYLTVLPLLYLFGHTKTWRKMEQIHTGKALNLLIGETSRNMLVFGALVVFVVCFRLLKDWFTTVVLA